MLPQWRCSLAYEAMTALGLLAAPSQTSVNLVGRVSGVRVVILGAGLSGMAAAYELGKAGFDCRLLEARGRPGGRVFTVRHGTASEETGSAQTATFDDGLYFNAGPMRISHHHRMTLAYCRELQVATEVFVPDCESAYLAQTRGPLAGRRIRLREARADFDGYIAELLSKSLSLAQLDQPLTAEDRERVLAYLRGLGALDESGQIPRLVATRRRRASGAARFVRRDPRVLRADRLVVSADDDASRRRNGSLPAALAARLGNRITCRAAVREIRQSDRGVWVIYADRQGQPRRMDADYCISTIPLPVLADIQKDVSQPVQSAIAAARYDGAGKIGLQFKRRFWDKTTKSMEADRGPTRKSARSSTPRTALPLARAFSSATTSISAAPCASARPPKSSASRSSMAHAFIRNIRPNSRMHSLSRGRGCRGAEAHGDRNRPPHTRRSCCYASLTDTSISRAIT